MHTSYTHSHIIDICFYKYDDPILLLKRERESTIGETDTDTSWRISTCDSSSNRYGLCRHVDMRAGDVGLGRPSA